MSFIAVDDEVESAFPSFASTFVTDDAIGGLSVSMGSSMRIATDIMLPAGVLSGTYIDMKLNASDESILFVVDIDTVGAVPPCQPGSGTLIQSRRSIGNSVEVGQGFDMCDMVLAAPTVLQVAATVQVADASAT